MNPQHDLQSRSFRPDSSTTRRNDDMPKDREEPLNLPNYYHDDQTKLENQIGRRRRDAKNPNGLPQSSEMATPHKSPFLSFYSLRKEGRYKRRGQIFHSFQRGIFALILEEILMVS